MEVRTTNIFVTAICGGINMSVKRALVLSGGGGKGAYHIGAWKALREIGFESDMVIGTSVGALNGALIAMEKYDEALDIWGNMGMEKVFTSFAENELSKDANMDEKLSMLAIEIFKNGGAAIGPLQELVYDMMDEQLIRSSKMRFGLVTTQFPKIKAVQLFVEDMPNDTIADYILASAACFPFMKTKKIGEMSFVDGGYTENMPIKMALDAGATEVVVVDISSAPDQIIVNDNATIRYIRSKALDNDGQLNTSRMLMFDKEISKRHMEQAYIDTLKQFDMLDGYVYSFKKGEKHNMSQYENESREIFKKIFCCLPFEGLVERRARENIINYIGKCVENPFEHFSNTMLCSEAAANIFKIDTCEIYSTQEFVFKILDGFDVANKEKAKDGKIDSLINLIDSERIDGIRHNLDMFEKRKIVVEITKLLLLGKIDEKQKNKIWLLGFAFPEIICASIFCAAVMSA
ncbi:MAG: patatin-like phospholipase family protein [Clostridia bacterium]|nr:patatin-like phospholipase family protein [Clostridia bacterium]